MNPTTETKSTTRYNGYKNRATWNVALWLANDEPLYRSAVEFAKMTKRNGKRMSGMRARYLCVGLFGTATPDGDNLSAVNWTEIASVLKELA